MFCFGPFRLWTYVWVCRISNLLKMRPPSEKNEDPPFATPPFLMRPPFQKMRPRGSQNHEKTSKIEGGGPQEKNLFPKACRGRGPNNLNLEAHP